jgi:hypothetical protein
MAHADPGSWTDLAVDVPTSQVECVAKVIYTKVFSTEEAVVDV